MTTYQDLKTPSFTEQSSVSIQEAQLPQKLLDMCWSQMGSVSNAYEELQTKHAEVTKVLMEKEQALGQCRVSSNQLELKIGEATKIEGELGQCKTLSQSLQQSYNDRHEAARRLQEEAMELRKQNTSLETQLFQVRNHATQERTAKEAAKHRASRYHWLLLAFAILAFLMLAWIVVQKRRAQACTFHDPTIPVQFDPSRATLPRW